MRHFSLLVLASALTGALALASPLSAQLFVRAEPAGFGSVKVIGNCPDGTGPLPNASCRYLRVNTAGNAPAHCQIRIGEPDPGTTLRGTVLFASGGSGADFYQGQPGGVELLRSLQSRGFRVVDRRWDNGWFTNTESPKAQSIRYAALLTWVRNNLFDGGIMCAVGNSGGAAEISYSLTTWARASILDVAVLCGGPPFSRIDYLCGSPPEPAWQAKCAQLLPAGVLECGTPMCTGLQPNGPCVRSFPIGQPSAEIYSDSILHPSPQLEFNGTRVHVLVGGQDCTVAVSQALLFHDAITSEKVLEFVPGTPHWMPTTQDGRDAIERALLGGTTCRAGAATLNVSVYPQVGGTLDLAVTGAPGDVYLVLAGFGSMITEVRNVGWFFLMPPVFPLAVGLLHPLTGRATASLPLPPFAGLSGLTVYDQAFSGPCLTNLVHAVIM